MESDERVDGSEAKIVLDDKILEVWLKETFLAEAKALGSPHWLEDLINQAFKQIPVNVLLEQAENLGLVKADDVRRMAQSAPGLPAKLCTDEGREVVKSWGAQHQVLPILRSLRQATKELHSFWQIEGHCNEAVLRGVGFIAMGSVVLDGEGIRTQLREVLSTSGSIAGFLREYCGLVTSGSENDIENIDRIVLDHPVLGRYIQDLIMKMEELSRPPIVTTCWEFSELPNSGSVAEVCYWLFKRR